MKLVMILKDKESQLHILVKHFKLQNDKYNHKLYETFVDIDKDFETINKIHIELIINSSTLSYSLLSLNHLKDKIIDNDIVKALEISISTNSLYALNYALYIKCAQFELGEAAIATNSFYSFNYAKYVLNGPFLLGEKVIASNLGNSICYA